MNIYKATMDDVRQALAACNAGFYAGLLEFHQTDREHLRTSERTGKPLKPRYISGVLRHAHKDAPGARSYPPNPRRPNGKRSRFADWQGHYDFMEQLLLLKPEAVIRSRRFGKAEYRGLLGFYHLAGQLKSTRVQYMGYQSTFGQQVGNLREAA